MQWASTITEAPTLERAVAELATGIAAQLGSAAPDLLLLHFGGRWIGRGRELAQALHARFPEARLVGCSGGGVLADGQEREGERASAVALGAGVLPDVWVRPFHVPTRELSARQEEPERWRTALDLVPEQQPVLFVFPDPFSVRAEAVVAGLEQAFPRCLISGGLVSGGTAPGDHELILDGESYRGGLVGVALAGDVQGSPLVAQGARPVGPLWTVTEGAGNVVRAVDGEPVIEAFERAVAAMSRHERELFRRTALVGVLPAPVEGRALRPGEVLMRPIVGLSRKHGVLAVGEELPEGARLQLHVRDRSSAVVELGELVSEEQRRSERVGAPCAAVVYSCLGRGEGLFGEPNHDSQVLREAFPGAALVGFFCNGEIGPVAGQTRVHGFTTAAVFLRPRGWS